MKVKLPNFLILGTISAAFALSVGAASAQDQNKGRPGRPDGEGRPLPPEIVEKFDIDKDGKLSPEERKAARDAHLKEFDADGDGKLNEQERQAARDAQRAKMLEKYDKDGDGKLSEEEKQAMPRPPRAEGPRDGDRPKGERKGPRDGEKAKKGPRDGDKLQGKP